MLIETNTNMHIEIPQYVISTGNVKALCIKHHLKIHGKVAGQGKGQFPCKINL